MRRAVALEREALKARVLALIERLADGRQDPAARAGLLVELADFQARAIEPYGRFRAQRQVAAGAQGLDAVPALPTDAFRFARLAAHAAAHDLRSFVSSGTTRADRSTHAFADLTLYDAAARAGARHALFPDRERMALVLLAPSEREAPESSLSYMLARFCEWFGERHVYVVHEGQLDLALLERTLAESQEAGRPLALLGTSFAFVHALDGLGTRRFALPAGSRIMQTGGYKGRSREVAPAELRAQLAHSFGVAERAIVAEYGMTELSSQLYEPCLREHLLGLSETPRRLCAPGWVRAVVVDPETLLPRGDDQPGLLRIDDAANLDSIACIQTADLAQQQGDGVILLGRAQGAVARGCSISADQLLTARREP